jgi:uncharacterized membrane protein YgcG
MWRCLKLPDPAAMRCPACHAPHGEADTECPACRFSLAALEASLGPPPAMMATVSDLAEALSKADMRRLREDLGLLEQQFQGLRAMLVTASPPPTLSLPIYAFWLFNRAGVFSAVEKGGSNHGLLLMIDPAAKAAAVAMGYGLEPLLPPVALEASLAVAGRYLAKGQIAAAAAGFFREMQRQLASGAPEWPRVFGVHEDLPWFDSTSGVLTLPGTPDGGDAY